MIYLMMIESQEDKHKFEILYEKYVKLMLKYANEILKDVHLAEDAVHESFVKIARSIDKIGEVDAKETKNFVMVITRHTTFDIYRKRSKNWENVISMDKEENAELLVVESNVDTEPENAVLHIIKNMDKTYSNVFLLKYVNGLDNKEIAKILKVSEEAIRKRLSRGKDIIENALEGMREQ